jgi:hypothetical protein
MSVDIAAGVCVVPGTEGGKQGQYTCLNDASLTVTVTASHPTLPRIDVVVMQIRDAQYSTAFNDAALNVIAGTPASSPAPATAPANSLVIAQVRVNAGVTSVLNSNVTDTRLPITSMGGIYPCTSSTKPTNNLYAGYAIWLTDTKTLQIWDVGSGSWLTISAYQPQWPSYSPTWSSSGTLPTIGNGSITGSWTQIGKIVHGRARITIGSTTAPGSGNYTISIPSNTQSGAVFESAGTCTIRDASAANTYGYVAFTLTSNTLAAGGSNGDRWSGSTPVVMANTDTISFAFTYEQN